MQSWRILHTFRLDSMKIRHETRQGNLLLQLGYMPGRFKPSVISSMRSRMVVVDLV
jgi:hypothetical protein